MCQGFVLEEISSSNLVDDDLVFMCFIFEKEALVQLWLLEHKFCDNKKRVLQQNVLLNYKSRDFLT